jgi:hypothetical protein
VGPIESKLSEFGARDGPKPGASVGFVLSAFGELSYSSYSLRTAIASEGAARAVSFWKIPPKHALVLCKQKILRFWDLAAQRGWARLILGRFHDFSLSPGDPTAATREQDSASYEHHIFFFTGTWHGAAYTAGFGWRGRIFLLLGFPCCVSISILLRGGREKYI